LDQDREADDFQEQTANDPYDHEPWAGGTHGMDTGIAITVYLTAALVAGIVAGVVAAAKQRHTGYWVIASFLFPPLVLILLLLPKGRGSSHVWDKDEADDRFF
jgi:hypothetical protein